VIAWMQLFRKAGSVAPGKMVATGRRSSRGVATGFWDNAERRTLRVRRLVTEPGGLQVDFRTAWEFVHAGGLSHRRRR
jgi:putative transposase